MEVGAGVAAEAGVEAEVEVAAGAVAEAAVEVAVAAEVQAGLVAEVAVTRLAVAVRAKRRTKMGRRMRKRSLAVPAVQTVTSVPLTTPHYVCIIERVEGKNWLFILLKRTLFNITGKLFVM